MVCVLLKVENKTLSYLYYNNVEREFKHAMIVV